MGNALNMADMSPIKDFNHQLSSLTGKVNLYISNANYLKQFSLFLKPWLISIPLFEVYVILQLSHIFHILGIF